MNDAIVYDLNETLYLKSSKEEFFKFVCYKKGYKIFNLFQISWYKLLGKLRLIDRTSFKENFYNYLNNLPPYVVREYSKEFWCVEYPNSFNQEMISHIKASEENGKKVLVITGSFEVYTEHLEELLPITVLGTRTQYSNGTYKVIGEACNGEEKIRRYKEKMGADCRLIEAYSDEKEEILFEAEKGYYVEGKSLELVQSKS